MTYSHLKERRRQKMTEQHPGGVCRILTLDGGGAKAFYTLGVLKEVEATLSRPIHEIFHLIFGTSTGSIIAALLSIGHPVDEIHDLYRKYVPMIMRAKCARSRTAALRSAGRDIFGDKGFGEARTGLGIVSVKWRQETPMIFKSTPEQAHGRPATFEPGFGCTIADAVEASCSAYPFFKRKVIRTSSGDEVELFDGGYCANNPTLYALADAIFGLGHAPKKCRVLSIGCGKYPRPSYRPSNLVKHLWPFLLVDKTLNVNNESMDQLRELLFSNVKTVRISDTFESSGMATDMFEHNLEKLNYLHQRGRESFGKREGDIRQLIISDGGQ